MLSLLVHLVLFLGLKVVFYEASKPEEPNEKWLEFKDIENAPLMSDTDKRVKKQTRIKETSPSTLSSLSKPNQSAPNPLQKLMQQQMEQRSQGNKNGDGANTEPRTSGDIYLNSAGGGQSNPQIRQRLQSFLPKDLEIGDMVNLNTDYNLFFTFYSRMAEKVLWPWAQNVMGGFEKLRMTGQLGGARKAWVTIIEVLLDKEGKVVSIHPMQLSGTSEIDMAPTKAFNQAKDFPNPPSEMVEEDGYIHIRYKFIVYYNPQSQQ